jgi:peptide chain release factor 1
MAELEQESGGHRIQRVPPTEKRGRVHTSTVTVAVLPLASVTATQVSLKSTDVSTEWFSGTGAGGQHRNKHQNSCRMTHIPTGITVVSQCRKRTQSYEQAWTELERRVRERSQTASLAETSAMRKEQVGTGMRADKIRTYRFQDDQVKDHMTGKTATCSQVMRGRFDLLR